MGRKNRGKKEEGQGRRKRKEEGQVIHPFDNWTSRATAYNLSPNFSRGGR